MLQCNQLAKGYSTEPLFSNVSLSIMPGERLGLIGRNGHGKSTLARILAGIEEPDEGNIITPPDYRIGYLEQHAVYDFPTALEVVIDALPLQEGDWKEIYHAEAALSGLGLDESMWSLAPDELSSGYQLRLRLARVLVGQYNLLILDEPTNYLDVPSIRWLKQFLQRYDGEMVLITHDRQFMDDVATHIAGIHRGEVRKVKGNTAAYYNFRDTEEERQKRERSNQLKRRESVEKFVERFRAKASKAAQVQSRINQLAREDVVEKLHDIATLQFAFKEAPFKGRWILHAEDLSFRYDQSLPYLFEKLSFSVRPGDRVGIVGANGKGKSTLLSILCGDLDTVNGRVVNSDSTAFASFHSRALQTLSGSHTIEEEITKAFPTASRTEIRTICGVMMFSGDDALKSIKVLSGGERARVLLAKVIATPSNCLLLDEPTHHLDMESCDALTTALTKYSGAVILITHDEYLLKQVATRLIVFQENGARVFEGSYDEFLSEDGWHERDDDVKPSSIAKRPKKLNRKQRAEIVQQYNKKLRPLRDRFSKVEKDIEKFEKEKATIEAAIVECSAKGKGNMQDLSKDHHAAETTLTELYEQYAGLDEEISALEESYNSQIND